MPTMRQPPPLARLARCNLDACLVTVARLTSPEGAWFGHEIDFLRRRAESGRFSEMGPSFRALLRRSVNITNPRLAARVCTLIHGAIGFAQECEQHLVPA